MQKIEGFEALYRWVTNANEGLSRGRNQVQRTVADNVKELSFQVSQAIQNEYPFYARELPKIVADTFWLSGGCYSINTAAFGELFLIVQHLHCEPQDASLWVMIHPRIVRVSKGLYEDGHYSSAANRSFVEVETRLREVFSKLKPEATQPSKAMDLIGGLLSEHGAYSFCDTSTQSGKDYRQGVEQLFRGAFSAYRNPSSHENTDILKEAAFDQIVLTSQLMKVLDNA